MLKEEATLIEKKYRTTDYPWEDEEYVVERIEYTEEEMKAMMEEELECKCCGALCRKSNILYGLCPGCLEYQDWAGWGNGDGATWRDEENPDEISESTRRMDELEMER